MQKKRVLALSESSWLATGFGRLFREILSRLHTMGFDVAELGSAGDPTDPRRRAVPWPYFSVKPEPGDEAGKKVYESNPLHEFGSHIWEETLLKVRPSHCLVMRDPWMDSHAFKSPYRSRYAVLAMPTVDAVPLNNEWVSDYLTSDSVLSYTEWALNVLREQGGSNMKVFRAAPMGCDYQTYRPPLNKRAHKEKLGLDPGSLIIGMVGRSQLRKLFVDLLHAFSRLLNEAPPEIAKRTYLWTHTAYPDQGWDFPRSLLEEGVAHRVFYTYTCYDCGFTFPARYSDWRVICLRCNNPGKNCGFANSRAGVTDTTLAQIYQCMDVYCQMACAEGFGHPALESVACGVPLMAPDYSAMSDICEKVGGTPIKIARYWREAGSHRLMGLFDYDDFLQKLTNLLQLPEEARQAMGYQQRVRAMRHFDWDRSAQTWAEAIEMTNPKEGWNSPPNLHIPVEPPGGLSDDDFIRFGLAHIAGRVDLLKTRLPLILSRNTQWGYEVQGGAGGDNPGVGFQRFTKFSREDCMNYFKSLLAQRNYWEKRRCGLPV